MVSFFNLSAKEINQVILEPVRRVLPDKTEQTPSIDSNSERGNGILFSIHLLERKNHGRVEICTASNRLGQNHFRRVFLVEFVDSDHQRIEAAAETSRGHFNNWYIALSGQRGINQ